MGKGELNSVDISEEAAKIQEKEVTLTDRLVANPWKILTT